MESHWRQVGEGRSRGSLGQGIPGGGGLGVGASLGRLGQSKETRMAGAEELPPVQLAGCSEMPIQPHPPPTGPSGGFSLCPFVAPSLTAFLSLVRPGSPRLQAFAVPSAWDSRPVTPQNGPSNCSSTDDCPRGPSPVTSPFLFPSPLTILSLLPWFTTFVCQVSCYPCPATSFLKAETSSFLYLTGSPVPGAVPGTE